VTAQLTQNDSKENFEMDNHLEFPGAFDDYGQNIFRMTRSSDADSVIGHPVSVSPPHQPDFLYILAYEPADLWSKMSECIRRNRFRQGNLARKQVGARPA
jgi:hypothetical protein